MALIRRLVPALVASLVWAVPLGAQESTGAVTGKVVDASTQQPLANVEVAIAGTPHRELSRSDGSFALNGVPAGTYRIKLIADPGNAVSEADETNNTLLTGVLKVVRPDLTVSSVTFTPAAIDPTPATGR